MDARPGEGPLLNKEITAECTNSLPGVCSRQGFFLTAWGFLPNHWHAILFPPYPLTISDRKGTSRRPKSGSALPVLK